MPEAVHANRKHFKGIAETPNASGSVSSKSGTLQMSPEACQNGPEVGQITTKQVRKASEGQQVDSGASQIATGGRPD
jgi:hypothetical protein